MKDESHTHTHTLRQTHTIHICVRSFFVINILWWGEPMGDVLFQCFRFYLVYRLEVSCANLAMLKGTPATPRPGLWGAAPHRLAHHSDSFFGASENWSVICFSEPSGQAKPLATALPPCGPGTVQCPAPFTHIPDRRPDGIPALC